MVFTAFLLVGEFLFDSIETNLIAQVSEILCLLLLLSIFHHIPLLILILLCIAELICFVSYISISLFLLWICILFYDYMDSDLIESCNYGGFVELQFVGSRIGRFGAVLPIQCN